MWDENWPASARCRAIDPDALFVTGARQHEAKRVCRECPVRTECLAEALDGHMEYGVWGGMTERERRLLVRRRPNVVSWRQLLQTAWDDQRRQSTQQAAAMPPRTTAQKSAQAAARAAAQAQTAPRAEAQESPRAVA